MYKQIIRSLLLGSVILASHNVQAENGNSSDTIIVTANRYSQSADDSMAAVTVISRQDIENSAAQDLPSLLSHIAGFDLKPSGPYGKNTSLFLRGTSSSQLLTLIDGIKIYSATSGGTAFQHIPLDQIERIEIVRGPRASLYGSEAIGGVIQIFTRKGHNKKNADIQAGTGSNSSREVSAFISGSTDKSSFSLNLRRFITDGIDVIRHTSVNDKDGYSNNSFNARIDYTFSKSLSLSSSFMNAQGNTQYDNCYNSSFATSDNCDSDYIQQVFSNTLKFTPDGNWDAQLQLGTSRDLSDNFWESNPNNTYNTQRIDASFINNFQIDETQLLTLGIDYADDSVDATPYAADAAPARNNVGVFAAWNSEYDFADISLSLRRDNNEQFNTYNTGSIAIGKSLSPQLRTYISYGTAFKAPTFNDLYFPFYGSPTLLPEESTSLEAGFKGKLLSASWSFDLYQTDIDNLIAYDSNTFLAGNINKARISGAELTGNMVIKSWNINLSASYTDPLNKSAANNGKTLQARAKQTLNIQASRHIGKYNISASLLAQGKRYTNSDNTESVAGYGVMDANIDYKYSKQISLSAKLNNIFDKDYIINQGFGSIYNTLGRTVFISMKYSM